MAKQFTIGAIPHVTVDVASMPDLMQRTKQLHALLGMIWRCVEWSNGRKCKKAIVLAAIQKWATEAVLARLLQPAADYHAHSGGPPDGGVSKAAGLMLDDAWKDWPEAATNVDTAAVWVMWILGSIIADAGAATTSSITVSCFRFNRGRQLNLATLGEALAPPTHPKSFLLATGFFTHHTAQYSCRLTPHAPSRASPPITSTPPAQSLLHTR